MKYDATITKIFNIPPYTFFAVIGVVFASSLFILLLLKYDYSIPRYTKVFFLSGIGLLIGARFFGVLTGLYGALANKAAINLNTFLNTGIVFYGGMLGFVTAFLLICKIWDKEINYGVVDLAVVCIPLFHFWGRLGCFFGGCCFGIENHSKLSVLYTNRTKEEEIVAVSRLPIQLFEAGLNIIIFIVLLKILTIQKLKGCLIMVYLILYPIIRIVMEFFRGDSYRGVWHSVSFSQVISMVIIIICFISIYYTRKGKNYVG